MLSCLRRQVGVKHWYRDKDENSKHTHCTDERMSIYWNQFPNVYTNYAWTGDKLVEGDQLKKKM